MKMEELVTLLMQHADEYAIEGEEKILVGMEPKRRHKNKRIQKKWLKMFGQKPVYKVKKCRKIEVTIPMIIDFCSANSLPIPDEIFEMMNGGNEE